ncbi:MAG TPA: glycosyltransferase family 2 protein [Bacilli bacterium]
MSKEKQPILPHQQRLIVFIPAHNEEATIAEVISRVPRDFDPHMKVEILLIDDGSHDRTVEFSRAAGAEHLYSFPSNRGLGSAVRKGLAEALQLEADYIVMIDADNEYPPEQIPELLHPLIKGKADYTMGSRFRGTIQGMKLHRRLGNYFFTFLQSLLLRRWIYDGQSGMRAFTRQAAQHAEIIHDYNYAQVITLNLMRKGFRMKEIPIRYQVRTKGQSFIKFNAYLAAVLPAIYREMIRPVAKVKIEKASTANYSLRKDIVR